MTKENKHGITTATVAVSMVLIAMFFTDGTLDNWKDYFLLLYPGAIGWLWLRLAGFLKFKKRYI